MSAIDNGEIGSIKKQIFLSLGLFFSYSNLGAVACPQTVGAVTPGESIWQVTSRIGQATNVIESQICALTLGTDLACTFTFGQSNIGGGGIYTITVPGTYCLTEDVTFTFGPAITINASNVTVDLQGFYIDGGSNFVASAIQLALSTGFPNLNSIIIQNGIIQNVAGPDAFTTAFGITQVNPNATLANIIIRDINFYNINTPSIGGSAFVAPVRSLLIENCNTFNGGILGADSAYSGGSSAVFRNIRSETYITGGSAGIGISTGGLRPISIPWTSVVIEDCIVTSSVPTLVGFNSGVISIASALNAVVRNCIVDGLQGFLFTEITNLVVSDCIAQNCLTQGFEYEIGSIHNAGAVFERCIAQNNTGEGFRFLDANFTVDYLRVIDCVANQNLHGFFVSRPTGIGRSTENLLFKNCQAANNKCGFLLSLAFGSIVNALFKNCIAQDNSGDGFSLVTTQPSNSLISNVTFIDCVSQRNRGGTDGVTVWRGDGFGIGSASTNVGPIFDVVCQSCVAQDNIHDGFNFASTATGCKILDCCAMHNTGTGISNVAGNTNKVLGNAAFNNSRADIFGVSDPSLLVSSVLVGGLAGATRWVNAIS